VTTTTDNTMMSPAIEVLLDHTRSKFSLVTLAAKRAREITEYFGNLKTSEVVGPTVETVSTKHLSVAFEEIAADKVRFVPKTLDEIRAEIAELQRQEDEANALAAAEVEEQPE
jgi:DNA-directed RNA polymerase subunit omega